MESVSGPHESLGARLTGFRIKSRPVQWPNGAVKDYLGPGRKGEEICFEIA
jgi:hypothetical protein